jgi:hypothetical protein
VKVRAQDRLCSCWGKASGPKAALSYRVRRFDAWERLRERLLFFDAQCKPASRLSKLRIAFRTSE